MGAAESIEPRMRVWIRVNRKWPWLKIILGLLVLTGILSIVVLTRLSALTNPSRQNWQTQARSGQNQMRLKDQEVIMDWSAKIGQRFTEKKKKLPKRTVIKLNKRLKQKDLTGKKLIALTFDDGPKRGTTERLLDILREKQVKVSFFVLGIMLEQAPEVARREKEEGHEVENHTTYHQDLRLLSADGVRQDVAITSHLIQSIIGEEPKLLRLPYGAVNDTVKASVGLPMVMWNIDARDWEVRETERIYEQVMGQAKDGGIILMHDIYETTIEAVPKLIDSLRANGYEFVTVSELARLRRVSLAPGQIYYDFRL